MDVVKIEKLQYLQIGTQGETGAEQIPIDMSSWVEELSETYPNLCFHLLFKPYNETVAIPMVTVYDATTHILTWEVTLDATLTAGAGYTEVRALNHPNEGLLKKSRIIPTLVENSVSGVEGGDIPAPYQDWVNSVLEVRDELDNILGSAVTSYQNSDSGVDIPTGPWSETPAPVKGTYLWSRLTYTWGTGSQTNTYIVSYVGMDGEGVVVSVNGQDGAVNLDAGDINVDDTVPSAQRETVQDAIGRLGQDIDEIAGKLYPVGSIYMSVNNTSPEELFGGTWERIKERFLLGAGDSISAGETGGAASVSYTPAGTVDGHILTVSEMPSHTHTFTGSAVTSGINSVGHTHTYTDYYATSATGSTTLTLAQIPSHTHAGNTATGAFEMNHVNAANWIARGASGTDPSGVFSGGGGDTGKYRDVSAATYSSSGPSYGKINFSMTPSVQNAGGGGGHTHTVTNTYTSRSSNGNSANHTHSVTAAGTNSSTGSGAAHSHDFTGTAGTISTMPPYLAVYMWKRTA